MSKPQHTLPELPYTYDALEPYVDAKTMEIHYTKHHAGYVQKLRAALDKYPLLFDVPVEELLRNIESVPEEIRLAVHNNAGGHANHSFFWPLLKKNEDGRPVGELAKAVESTFGSFDAFKTGFSDMAASHFGSGWAWLSVARFGNLIVHSTGNQHSPLIHDFYPVVGLDLWEHAYYLKYQNRRPEYIEAFFNIINWDQAEENYNRALEYQKR
ncbi:MAG: superoxide dismutase [Myxococcota bacterium]|nr:superoxide dismutase [Myxococcota bacterium]